MNARPDIPPTVHQCVAAVMADVRELGKGGFNPQGGYQFRGVDAVMNAVGPVLRQHATFVVPIIETYDYGEILVGHKRTPMGHARVTVTYRWFGPAGDFLDTRTAGEAFDSGDKATSKAMSVAFRTALLQTLCLPTFDRDPDMDTHERAPAEEDSAAVDPPMPVAQTDVPWFTHMVERITATESPAELRGLWAEMAMVNHEGRLEAKDAAELEELFRKLGEQIKQQQAVKGEAP